MPEIRGVRCCRTFVPYVPQERPEYYERRQVGVGLGHQTHPGAGRPIKHPRRNFQPTACFGGIQITAESNAVRPLDHLMNANTKTSPRMPRVQQLPKLGTVGVLKPRCKTMLGNIPAPVWFLAALVPMVASQVLRLDQHDPAGWIFWDYSGRLGGLAILAAIPAASAVAFRPEKLRMTLWHVALWIAAVVIADHYVGGWIRRTVNGLFPATVLGSYPQPTGWLYWIDTVFGIALVAYTEEVVFRRCARHVFQTYLGGGYAMVVVTSLLFGAYHWWTGLGNILEATMMGVLFMLFLQRSEALWPVVLGHYLTDIVDFA